MKVRWQVAAVGQVGLCPLAGEPLLADALAQVPEEALVVEVHRCLTPMMTRLMMCLSSTP